MRGGDSNPRASKRLGPQKRSIVFRNNSISSYYLDYIRDTESPTYYHQPTIPNSRQKIYY